MVKAQSSLMSQEFDVTWQRFLQKRVNSFVKWDLVRFFHDNPHTIDTAENIARVVGRDIAIIRQELDGLVKTDVLTRQAVSGQSIYRLTSNDDTRQLIREFVAACHDRDFREDVIHYVSRGMSHIAHHN